MLREQAQRTPPGQRARVLDGWTGAQFAEKRIPTVSDLNAAAPDTAAGTAPVPVSDP
jgi:predicted amidohydrolase YtcJ